MRQAKGMTSRALALNTGTSSAFVCDVEKGRRGISLKMVPTFADALGVEVEELAMVVLQAKVDEAGLPYTVGVSPSDPLGIGL